MYDEKLTISATLAVILTLGSIVIIQLEKPTPINETLQRARSSPPGKFTL